MRIIADRRAARRTKGIAYVEFYEIESVPKVHSKFKRIANRATLLYPAYHAYLDCILFLEDKQSREGGGLWFFVLFFSFLYFSFLLIVL